MVQDLSPQSPGQVLRAARLARGVSLDEAHEGTKIPLRLLEAIERDEYHQLSDTLYVKSFLRNYASWVGADVAEVIGLFDQIAGRPDAAPSGRGAGMVWTEDQVSVTRIGTPWRRYLITATIVLVLAAAAIWFIWLRPSGPTSPQGAVRNSNAEAGFDSAGIAPSLAPVMAEVPTAQAGESLADRQSRLDRDTLAAVAATPLAAGLSTPMRGDPSLQFQGGERFALVLRVVLPRAVNCSVRRDGQTAAVPVIWREQPLPLPAANVRHGEAYAVRDGYAAYWGANDHFTLILDNLPGAEVTLNGVAQPVDRWRPNQPVVLDRATLGPDR